MGGFSDCNKNQAYWVFYFNRYLIPVQMAAPTFRPTDTVLVIGQMPLFFFLFWLGSTEKQIHFLLIRKWAAMKLNAIRRDYFSSGLLPLKNKQRSIVSITQFLLWKLSQSYKCHHISLLAMPFQSSPPHPASPLISGSTDRREYMENLFPLMSVSVTRSAAAGAGGKFSTL